MYKLTQGYEYTLIELTTFNKARGLIQSVQINQIINSSSFTTNVSAFDLRNNWIDCTLCVRNCNTNRTYVTSLKGYSCIHIHIIYLLIYAYLLVKVLQFAGSGIYIPILFISLILLTKTRRNARPLGEARATRT